MRALLLFSLTITSVSFAGVDPNLVEISSPKQFTYIEKGEFGPPVSIPGAIIFAFEEKPKVKAPYKEIVIQTDIEGDLKSHKGIIPADNTKIPPRYWRLIEEAQGILDEAKGLRKKVTTHFELLDMNTVVKEKNKFAANKLDIEQGIQSILNDQDYSYAPYDMKNGCDQTSIEAVRDHIAWDLQGLDLEFLSYEGVEKDNHHGLPYGAFVELDFRKIAEKKLADEDISYDGDDIVASVASHIRCHAVTAFDKLQYAKKVNKVESLLRDKAGSDLLDLLSWRTFKSDKMMFTELSTLFEKLNEKSNVISSNRWLKHIENLSSTQLVKITNESIDNANTLSANRGDLKSVDTDLSNVQRPMGSGATPVHVIAQ